MFLFPSCYVSSAFKGTFSSKRALSVCHEKSAKTVSPCKILRSGFSQMEPRERHRKDNEARAEERKKTTTTKSQVHFTRTPVRITQTIPNSSYKRACPSRDELRFLWRCPLTAVPLSFRQTHETMTSTAESRMPGFRGTRRRDDLPEFESPVPPLSWSVPRLF